MHGLLPYPPSSKKGEKETNNISRFPIIKRIILTKKRTGLNIKQVSDRSIWLTYNLKNLRSCCFYRASKLCRSNFVYQNRKLSCLSPASSKMRATLETEVEETKPKLSRSFITFLSRSSRCYSLKEAGEIPIKSTRANSYRSVYSHVAPLKMC